MSRRPLKRTIGAVVIALAMLAGVIWVYAPMSHRDALWRIVATKCLPHWIADHNPSPCARIDLANGIGRGTVILKDLVGVAQFLAMPTAPISGIESTALLGPDAPNLLAAGWQAHDLVEQRLGVPLPRTALSLAINSTLNRSQDHAHVHVSCLRTDVARQIASLEPHPAVDWAANALVVDGRPYAVRRLDAPLRSTNVIDLVRDYVVKSGTDLSRTTIVVVGSPAAATPDDVLIIVGIADPVHGNVAHGEDLQDHTCVIAANRR